MSQLSDVAGLAVAALDLKVVQDVIGAMRAADAAVQGGQRSPLTPAPVMESARHIHPDPIYCRPQVIHPEPRFAPRQTIHQTPRFEVRLALAPIESHPPDKYAKCPSSSGIKPVWSVLPWEEPAKAPTQVKVVRYHTDILHKGSLIDMFI